MRVYVCLSVVALIASAASAQVVFMPSHLFNGEMAGDQFGTCVKSAGDVNNDGFDDVIVGAPFADSPETDSGEAQVYSGAGGGLLYTFGYSSSGPFDSERSASSVSGAGDVNNDGFDDLIVGSPLGDNNGTNSGAARVFSGADGERLYLFVGDSPGDQLGFTVSGAGDVNLDGFDDVIVGAPNDDNNGSNSGSARVFSGATGAILYTLNGDSPADFFGSSVSGASDLNNDGRADFIVGATQDDNNGSNSGSARVFSGATGGILYTFNGDSSDDFFGGRVSGAGDVNNDGYPDLIVGAAGASHTFPDSGSARVFSGINGAILHTFYADSLYSGLGGSVSGAGDVDNDGFDDVIVGAASDNNNGNFSGSATIFSGKTGAILHTVSGSLGDSLGISVSAGDVNNDGFADVIVGAFNDDNTGSNSGSVRIFLGLPVAAPHCPGDADGSRAVNFADITNVLTNFNLACP